MGKKNRNKEKGGQKHGRKAPAGQGKGGSWHVVLIGALVIGLGGYGFWGGTASSPQSKGISHRVPGGETRAPLSPALFSGVVARAYRVAQEIPETLDKLYCYCYCIENHGHLSNLSCFVGRHAAG